MKAKFILMLFLAFNISNIFAQNTLKVKLIDCETKEPLIGASVVLQSTTNGASSDTEGVATLSNIPDGNQKIEVSYMGYEKTIKEFTFPLPSDSLIVITIEPDENELQEIVVSSTDALSSYAFMHMVRRITACALSVSSSQPAGILAAKAPST